MRYYLILTCIFCALTNAFLVKAQENEQVFIKGRQYLDINIRSLNKYARRVEKSQLQLLRKLKRKEGRLARRLLRTDSTAYVRLKSGSINFDSISRLVVHPDSATMAMQTLKGGQRAIDSLKGVCNFLQSKSNQITEHKAVKSAANLVGYDGELNELKGKLSYSQYINDLTNKHANSLSGIAGNKTGITGIQKEIFYAKSKINEWKKLADDPSAAEEKALEYLQGTNGFDLSMNNAINGGGDNMKGASADELEMLGFQTKKMMNAALQQKFGNNIQAVSGSVGKEISQWQDRAQGMYSEVKETKQSLAALKHTGKPSFKVNPMRGFPFWQRLEKQYNFNTARATTSVDGSSRPAILSLSAGLAYRQTPKLSAGIGVAGDLGLGQKWSEIRVTFEGIGLRAFITWELQYGIGVYGGYERIFRQYAFKEDGERLPAELQSSVHSTNKYSESVLLGLTKKYKINSKWNGAVQLLYDLWWRDKGLRSPIVLRFQNSK